MSMKFVAYKDMYMIEMATSTMTTTTTTTTTTAAAIITTGGGVITTTEAAATITSGDKNKIKIIFIHMY